MHSVTFQHINQQNAAPLKSKNHYEPRRRDNLRRQSILAAVREAKEGFENLLANAALLPGELAGVMIAHLQALAPLFT